MGVGVYSQLMQELMPKDEHGSSQHAMSTSGLEKQQISFKQFFFPFTPISKILKYLTIKSKYSYAI